MKILFAIKTLNQAGGAERVLADVSAGLHRRGQDVSILTFDDAPSFYALPDVERIRVSIGDTKTKSGFSTTLKRVFALRKVVKAERPSCVIAFMHSMYVPMALALIGTGIPVIASEHIVPAYYKDKKLEYALLLLSALLVKKMTVLSEAVKAQFPKVLHSRIVAIPNPVTMPESGSPDSDSTIILNIGRLTDQKDQDTLIRAFAVIAAAHPNWNLKIIGDGKLLERLEALVQELNLNGRVHLSGTTQDIDAEYRRAGLFVLSSLYESFGMALAEAMAHELPVIGFADCPGVNELIADGQNGLLVDGDDRVSDLAQAIEQLIGDAALRSKLGEQGRKDIAAYHPDIIAEQWEDVVRAAA